jgi:hypothetical protein
VTITVDVVDRVNPACSAEYRHAEFLFLAARAPVQTPRLSEDKTNELLSLDPTTLTELGGAIDPDLRILRSQLEKVDHTSCLSKTVAPEPRLWMLETYLGL